MELRALFPGHLLAGKSHMCPALVSPSICDMGLAKLLWLLLSQAYPQAHEMGNDNRSELGSPSLISSVGPIRECGDYGLGKHSGSRRQGAQPGDPHYNPGTRQSGTKATENLGKWDSQTARTNLKAWGWGWGSWDLEKSFGLLGEVYDQRGEALLPFGAGHVWRAGAGRLNLVLFCDTSKESSKERYLWNRHFCSSNLVISSFIGFN